MSALSLINRTQRSKCSNIVLFFCFLFWNIIFHNLLSCFFSVALLFVILIVVRRRRESDGELHVARAPLLHKERPQGRYYGIPCDAEPVYAGWWSRTLWLCLVGEHKPWPYGWQVQENKLKEGRCWNLGLTLAECFDSLPACQNTVQLFQDWSWLSCEF